jgi:hypothetical protein
MNYYLEDRIWWNYLEHDLKELLKESQTLVKRVGSWKEKFNDYAFVVFPTSKAYEGFLKKLFLDLGFINEDDYYGKRFRIGKALNPSLDKKYRYKEGIFDKMVEYCGGKDLAEVLWRAWKSCRNLLFHWFPRERNAISFNQAKQRIAQVLDAMDKAFEECKSNL